MAMLEPAIEAQGPVKRCIDVGNARVAYLEEGSGDPVLLLHGCPFASFVWRDVIAQLASDYRCLAPDLLGLGDTETAAGADWSLPAQAAMVLGFLDALGIDRAHVVGHDHGGAIAQLLAAGNAERVACLVLCNAEAYDNWPSRKERPFLVAARTPVIGRIVVWLWSRRPVLRSTLIRGAAVSDRSALSDDLLGRYVAANLRNARRRAKTRRFLRGQMNATNQHTTVKALDGLRRFDHPTLLLWGADDPHFGPQWARRLREDIPGIRRLELIPRAGHLVMTERPDRFAHALTRFLSDPGPPREMASARETTCCVVGAGPAGAMLALLLARHDIPVVLLESHADFDRDFRGDSVHPAIMEILDQLGLADAVLELPHRKMRSASLPTDPPLTVPFDVLRSRFPFVTLMAQQHLLEFLTRQAARYPAFTLITNATARELILTDGGVRGVRYRSADGLHEITATLTVGADGRSSTVRREADLPAVTYGSAIDVLWLRLPRRPTDPEGIVTGTARGLLILAADRGDRWQLGLTIPKGDYGSIRAAGLEPLRDAIAHAIPLLADRVAELADWQQVAMLSVRADRLTRWYRPGLLLIGDAAHTMSPVAGNGINYAVADAVAAANVLAPHLARATMTTGHLAAVQRRRDLPTRITQYAVARAQDRLLATISRGPTEPPVLVRLALRVSLLRRQAIRIAAYGVRPERLHTAHAKTTTSP
jgi:2-polyprenyl-6-methoxyphenol hydroxylase-like FAD-dependent oxidoreductase/pimeloyl-ACP methyl ester carboxylesterase